MGLGLHWELSADGAVDNAGALRVVSALRESALSLGFGEVGEVVEAWAGVHAAGDEDAMAERAWALSQGMVTVAAPTDDDTRRTVRIAPTHVVAFRGYSAGAEEAVFGLAWYDALPSAVPAAGGGATSVGYRWASGCATQGAMKRGGARTFLAAHRAIVGVLDKARTAGLNVTVKDDGGYWETRDPKALFDKLEAWEELVAAIARKRAPGRAVPLASDVKAQIEARRRDRPRLDREPAEELEG